MTLIPKSNSAQGACSLLDPHLETEEDLGRLLLAIVASSRAVGLDPERALRQATRELQVEIRSSELSEATDAGVIGLADS